MLKDTLYAFRIMKKMCSDSTCTQQCEQVSEQVSEKTKEPINIVFDQKKAKIYFDALVKIAITKIDKSADTYVSCGNEIEIMCAREALGLPLEIKSIDEEID